MGMLRLRLIQSRQLPAPPYERQFHHKELRCSGASGLIHPGGSLNQHRPPPALLIYEAIQKQNQPSAAEKDAKN